MRTGMNSCATLVARVRACRICEQTLPFGPRPVLQLHPSARVLIAGQAPGRKVHDSGVPFDDASGKRLREWMGVSENVFYNAQQIAILPMGFCYPGTGKSGDLPPQKQCAVEWREQLMAQLPALKMTLVIGSYAQQYHFKGAKLSVTDRVLAWHKHWPLLVPLPHPSPRNNIWLSKNPWFESDLLPKIRTEIDEILSA